MNHVTTFDPIKRNQKNDNLMSIIVKCDYRYNITKTWKFSQ